MNHKQTYTSTTGLAFILGLILFGLITYFYACSFTAFNKVSLVLSFICCLIIIGWDILFIFKTFEYFSNNGFKSLFLKSELPVNALILFLMLTIFGLIYLKSTNGFNLSLINNSEIILQDIIVTVDKRSWKISNLAPQQKASVRVAAPKNHTIQFQFDNSFGNACLIFEARDWFRQSGEVSFNSNQRLDFNLPLISEKSEQNFELAIFMTAKQAIK